MKYFDVEIYDGVPFKEIYLDASLSLESQYLYLSEDITCIDYDSGGYSFSLDVGWYTDRNAENGYFRVKVLEGPKTDGGVFYVEYCHSIDKLKILMQEGADLIQKLLTLRHDEILSHIPDDV